MVLSFLNLNLRNQKLHFILITNECVGICDLLFESDRQT